MSKCQKTFIGGAVCREFTKVLTFNIKHLIWYLTQCPCLLC